MRSPRLSAPCSATDTAERRTSLADGTHVRVRMCAYLQGSPPCGDGGAREFGATPRPEDGLVDNKLNCEIDLYDPWADRREIKNIYDIYPVKRLKENRYHGIILAVRHKKFKDMGIKTIKRLCKTNHVIYDLKYLFLKNQVDLRL